MNRAAQNLLLLLFGAAITLIAATGTYLNYVRPVMLPFLLVSGVVILALAGFGMASHVRADELADQDWDVAGPAPGADGVEPTQGADGVERAPGAGLAPDDHADHGHAHGGGAVAWILVVPVLLLLFAPPPPLGAGSAPAPVAASYDAADMRPFPPLPAGTDPAVSVYDFQDRAVSDATHALDHTDVTLTGFVLRSGTGVSLGRLMIWCCVADARTIEVSLRGEPVTAATGQWIEAVVRLVPGTATRYNDYAPAATVRSWKAVPTPRKQYDY